MAEGGAFKSLTSEEVKNFEKVRSEVTKCRFVKIGNRASGGFPSGKKLVCRCQSDTFWSHIFLRNAREGRTIPIQCTECWMIDFLDHCYWLPVPVSKEEGGRS